jgi:kynureninase
MDADAICRHAHSVGALVSLDSFHAVGIVPVDVKRSGVDFLTGGVLKWLCGGPGACFLYVSPGVRDELKPALTGWQAHTRPFAFEESMEYTTGAFRWLNGTPVIPALYAAAEGPRILRRAGIASIREYSSRLTSRLIDLADKAGYTVHTPRNPAQRGGTVTLDVPHGYEVTQHLLSRNILVDYRVGSGIRIAPHFFTKEEELDEAVHDIGKALESGSWQRYSEKITVVT